MSPAESTLLALVVDDDEVFRTRLCRALTERNWEAEAAANGDEALRMPGKSGLEVVQELRAADPSMTIIMLTGYGSIPTAIAATKLGAGYYLSKPADADQILTVYENLRVTPSNGTEAPDTVPSLARVEWEHLHRVISDCGGNISQAARLLGIHRRSLQRKLGKYPPAR